MKVLNICQDDWANFAYDNAMALRSVNVKADAICLNKHVFDYENHAEVVPLLANIRKRIEHYDTIQFFHDNTNFFRLIISACAGKRMIVYHTSSYYRKNYAAVDQLMNEFADVAVCAMPEFMALCNHKNKVYMVGAVDTERLKPDDSLIEYKFAHYPSNPEVKGTEDIIFMMNGISDSFRCLLDLVPYAEQIERMRKCDVYIEMFSFKDGGGMPYGNFGITALEAAALGKVVVTNCKDVDVYQKHYGTFALTYCNDDEAFKTWMNFLNSDDSIIRNFGSTARYWVVENHSYKASGQYILKNILNQ